MSEPVLVLGARDVRALLDLPACIAAVERTLRAHHAGHAHGPVSSGFALPGGSVHAKTAAVLLDGRTFVVVKANVNLPGNPSRGRPTIQGALILLDGDDGPPLAIMDSMSLTSLRTAAVAALAADRLAVSGADTITIVGCGEQGDSQLRAMAAIRPLHHAWVLDSDAAKAADFASRLARVLHIDVRTTDDLAGALRISQICVTCTTSQSAIIHRSHLHPGLFIAAVGADNPAKQEIHPDVLAASRVVVDSLPACAAGGDLHHAIDAGVMTDRDVYAELAAVVSGQLAGRTTADEIFVFDSTGTALQDVAAAVLVYERAHATGAGLKVAMGD